MWDLGFYIVSEVLMANILDIFSGDSRRMYSLIFGRTCLAKLSGKIVGRRSVIILDNLSVASR